MKTVKTMKLLASLQFAILVAAGTVGYLLRANNAVSWGIWFAAAVAAGVVALRRAGETQPGVIAWMAPFALLLIANIFLVVGSASLLVPAARYFLIAMLVSAALASVDVEHHAALLKQLKLILLFQIPIIAVQALYFMPRAGSWDAVVGTFGGDPYGGGNSAGLGLFLALSLAALICEFRYGKAKLSVTVGFCTALFACAALAEIKMFVLTSPVVVLLCYRDAILRNPAKLLAVASLAVCMVATMGFVYAHVFYAGFINSPGQLLEYVAPELMGQDIYVDATGEVGRITALRYWWERNAGDPLSLLLGHGALWTQESGAFSYGSDSAGAYQLGNTTAAAVLWELGVLGFVCYISPVLAAIFLASRKSARTDARLKSIYETCVIGGVVWILFLFHSLTQYQTPQSQWIGALIVGIAFGKIVKGSARGAA